VAAEENIETIQRIYRAFGEGDVDTILGLVTDDVDWATDGATGAAPWHRPWTGKDGVASFFAGIAEATEVSEFTVIAIAATETEVLTFVRYGFAKRGSGAEPATMHLHHYFRFRDGRIDYVRSAEDTALVAEVLAG
jgi:ketosteroid isomerase-like protein